MDVEWLETYAVLDRVEAALTQLRKIIIYILVWQIATYEHAVDLVVVSASSFRVLYVVDIQLGKYTLPTRKTGQKAPMSSI